MICAAMLMTQTAMAQGRPVDPVESNVYVQLYKARSERYTVRIESAMNSVNVATANVARVNYLQSVGAVCSEEADEYRMESELRQTELKAATARADESKMMLEVAIVRISAGLDMPICADVRL
jgi:multidrug resistance efflux pump